MEYLHYNDFFIESLSKPEIEEIIPVINNLSVILGDIRGYLSPSTVQFVTKEIDYIYPGIDIKAGNMNLYKQDILINFDYPIANYNPYMCIKGYEIYLNILQGKSTLPDKNITDKIYSPLLMSLIATCQEIPIILCTKRLYIELYALYRYLILLEHVTQIPFSEKEVQTIIDNIRWCSTICENTTSKIPRDLIMIYRDIEKTLCYMLTIPSLFQKQYSDEIDEFNNTR